MKICSKCKVEKLFSEFYNDKTRKDGKKPECKACAESLRRINKGKSPNRIRQSRILIFLGDTHVVCRECGTEKIITEFCKSNKTPSGYTRMCKVCRSREEQEKRDKNPAVARGRNLKSKYGLSIEEWNILFKDQNSCCAICKTDNPYHKNGWQTDHNHLTSQVRGILCHRCNITVGHVENGWGVEVPVIIEYLKYHNGLAPKGGDHKLLEVDIKCHGI